MLAVALLGFCLLVRVVAARAREERARPELFRLPRLVWNRSPFWLPKGAI